MKRLKEDELYRHLHGFLKARGIELTEGDYARCVREGCGLLSDAINLSQRGIQKARRTAATKLDRLRQVVHQKTAPKASPAAATPKTARAKKAPHRSNVARKETVRRAKARPNSTKTP